MKTHFLAIILLWTAHTQAQEFGVNDLRISDSNGIGWSSNHKATNPSAAYNSLNDQYLVIWEADDVDFEGVVANEKEIIGQIIDANGVEIGSDFIITSLGGYGNAYYDANYPSVAYNSLNNEYLVVYNGDRLPGEDEIYGTIISDDGSIVERDFRISKQGIDGISNIDAFEPQIAYNSIDNNYLVIWKGDNSTDNEFEIWGQIIDDSAKTIGNNFRISVQGIDGDASYDAFDPDLAWNSIDNEYLIVWDGDSSVSGEKEIYGQRLNSTGNKLGSNFRISNQGTDGDINFDAIGVKVAYNPINNNYLAVWFGDKTIGENEIYGQLISNDGTEVGVDFRISSQGADNDKNFGATYPDITWQKTNNSYAIVWSGDTAVSGEKEIYFQEVTNQGNLKNNCIKLSDMGPQGNKYYYALDPTVIANSEQGLLIAWEGNDNTDGMLATEVEIFIQMYGNAVLSTEEMLFEQETSIYPNPNNGIFTLQYSGNDDLEKATVFDATGKTVTTIPLQGFNQSKTINLQNIAKGIYLIKVESNQRSITQKILIK